MNSKMIAIIAVVAMCGAALVGVGYAYTATYTDSTDAGVAVEYVTITNGAGFAVDTLTITYNTVSNASITTYSIDNIVMSEGAGWIFYNAVAESDESKITDASAYKTANHAKIEVGKISVKNQSNVGITGLDAEFNKDGLKFSTVEGTDGEYTIYASYTFNGAEPTSSVGGFTLMVSYDGSTLTLTEQS